MTQSEYLEAEFRRYFPDAENIKATVHDTDEAIHVDVYTMGGAHVQPFYMEIGSDDDYYVFTNTVSGAIITVPFHEEAE